MKPVIALVEDSKTFQEALARVVSESSNFRLGTIYGSAEDAEALLDECPDVVIVDIQLPEQSGIDLIRSLRRQGGNMRFLVCSIHDDDDKIMQALESGAEGYILKDSSATQIRAALEELLQGGAPMSPYIARRVISFFRKPADLPPAAILTIREQEVLNLLAAGLQYKQIADRLFLSVETVKTHLRNIYAKLHVQNKMEAVNKWRNKRDAQ
ncbi:MAG: response regulator transcription factor [Chitinophagaceae bacterium]|nr:MAG: response regulator transcription factor [Chitinophagaceae bacterium]